jgi:hypothetical protein
MRRIRAQAAPRVARRLSDAFSGRCDFGHDLRPGEEADENLYDAQCTVWCTALEIGSGRLLGRSLVVQSRIPRNASDGIARFVSVSSLCLSEISGSACTQLSPQGSRGRIRSEAIVWMRLYHPHTFRPLADLCCAAGRDEGSRRHGGLPGDRAETWATINEVNPNEAEPRKGLAPSATDISRVPNGSQVLVLPPGPARQLWQEGHPMRPQASPWRRRHLLDRPGSWPDRSRLSKSKPWPFVCG